MGQGTMLANAVKEFDVDVEKEFIYEQTLIIGKSVGYLFAFSFDI